MAQTLTMLSRYGWTALHDVHWPGRPLANIDHIAIGPGGVVVIDAKNWTGDVTLRDGELRQNGHGRDRELEGAAASTGAVTALLVPAHRTAVLGVICLAGQDQECARTSSGVLVVGRLQLTSFLVSLPHRLTPYDVADVGRHLTAALGGPASPSMVTTAALDHSPRAPGRDGWASCDRRVPGGRERSRPSNVVRRPPPRRGRSRRDARSALRSATLRLVITAGIGLVLLANLGRIAGYIGSTYAPLVAPTSVTQVHSAPPAG